MRPSRILLTLLLLTTALRLVLASLTGLGDSEAYYTAWSLHLQPSYFDHPPLVAFMIAASTRLTLLTPLAVRIGPILLIALTTALLYLLARRLHVPPRGALIASILLLITPVFAIGGITASPDMPLAALWLAALLAAHATLARPTTPRYLLCGLLLGLAFLAKYTALLLIPAFLLAAHRADTPRPPWRDPRFYAAGLLALLIASPVLLWNLQHDLASLRYHALDRHTHVPFHPRNLAALIGGQIGYFSPLLCALFLWTWIRVRRRRRDHSATPSERLLDAFSTPVLCTLYLLSWATSEAEPHWPAMGYLPLYILAGAELDAASRRLRRRWLAWTLSTALLLQALFFTHATTPLFVSLMPDDYEPRYDIVNELYGWPRVLDTLTSRAHEAQPLDPPPRVAGMHYVMCAQIAAGLGSLSRTACPSPKRDAFDDLLTPVQPGEWILFIRDNRYTDTASDILDCDTLIPLGEPVVITRGDRPVRTFHGELCRVSHSW